MNKPVMNWRFFKTQGPRSDGILWQSIANRCLKSGTGSNCPTWLLALPWIATTSASFLHIKSVCTTC